MRCVAMMLVVGGALGVARAEEAESVFSELDRKITAQLDGEAWHYASKTFVRVFWEDYKKAHLDPGRDTSIQSVFGTKPEAESYDEYLGSFDHGSDAEQAFLEVTKSRAGRFFVKLEGHSIPAVARNKCIVFTTGDVVYSPMPPLGGKPYCAIEVYMLLLARGKFYLATPLSSPDQWIEVSRIKKRR